MSNDNFFVAVKYLYDEHNFKSEKYNFSVSGEGEWLLDKTKVFLNKLPVLKNVSHDYLPDEHLILY